VSGASKHSIRCPDCGADLVVDALTGEILSHRKAAAPLAGGKTLDSLFAELESKKASVDERFERERTAHADRERLLEEKFREALKRADETPDEAVRRPFDDE
jgi:hypothetical protein